MLSKFGSYSLGNEKLSKILLLFVYSLAWSWVRIGTQGSEIVTLTGGSFEFKSIEVTTCNDLDSRSHQEGNQIERFVLADLWFKVYIVESEVHA